MLLRIRFRLGEVSLELFINNVLYFLCVVEGKALHRVGAGSLRNVSKICGKGERKPQENRCGGLLAGLGQMDLHPLCILVLSLKSPTLAWHLVMYLGSLLYITQEG